VSATLPRRPQPDPRPGDGRDVILDLVENLDTDLLEELAQRRAFPPTQDGKRRAVACYAQRALSLAGLLGAVLGYDVRRELLARRELGLARYKTTLQPKNGRDALEDMFDELLDSAAYAHQWEMEQ
jgi:hypothetical protein